MIVISPSMARKDRYSERWLGHICDTNTFRSRPTGIGSQTRNFRSKIDVGVPFLRATGIIRVRYVPTGLPKIVGRKFAGRTMLGVRSKRAQPVDMLAKELTAHWLLGAVQRP